MVEYSTHYKFLIFKHNTSIKPNNKNVKILNFGVLQYYVRKRIMLII